jgi:SAM-dependent methyltransferase
MKAPRIFTPEYYARMRDLEDASWWNAGMRDVAAALLSLHPLPHTGRMVDIGCGSGQTMTWFERLHPGWETVGIDVAAEGLAAARARGTRLLACASALDVPLPSRSADVVVSLDVLQHLPLGGGDQRALGEMARVLKGGGTLLLRTNAQSFPYTPDDPAYQFHKFTVRELERKLAGAGFQVRRVSRVNAILGLAEIPRELRVRRSESSYHGLLAEPRGAQTGVDRLKRRWLRAEGSYISRGGRLPFGRTIVALCSRE